MNTIYTRSLPNVRFKIQGILLGQQLNQHLELKKLKILPPPDKPPPPPPSKAKSANGFLFLTSIVVGIVTFIFIKKKCRY